MNKLILISIINLIFFFNTNAEEVFESHSKASELIDKKKCEEAQEILLQINASIKDKFDYNDFNALTYFLLTEAYMCEKKYEQAIKFLQIMLDWNRKNITPEFNAVNIINHLNYANIYTYHFKDYQKAYEILTYVSSHILTTNIYWGGLDRIQDAYKIKYEDFFIEKHNVISHEVLKSWKNLKDDMRSNQAFNVKANNSWCLKHYRSEYDNYNCFKSDQRNIYNWVDKAMFLSAQEQPWNIVNNTFRVNELRYLSQIKHTNYDQRDIESMMKLNRLEAEFLHLNKFDKIKNKVKISKIKKQIFKIYKFLQKKCQENCFPISSLYPVPSITLEGLLDDDEIIIYLKYTNFSGNYKGDKKLYIFITTDYYNNNKPITWLYDSKHFSDNMITDSINNLKTNISNPYTEFDTNLSQFVFKTLINTEKLDLKKKISFIVDEDLMNLPFNALVKPNGKFLLEEHDISVFTSPRHYTLVKSLETSVKELEFIGFGNPRYNNKKDTSPIIFNTKLLRSSQITKDYITLFSLIPNLPETKKEILDIEELFLNTKVFLGKDANEKNFKSINNLKAQYLSIATHATISGEFSNLAEPSILLTPISKNKNNNGILTSSEIANLHLDIDLAVLSACNTYASVDKNSSALSGLANSFFIAGVKSIMVSMWSVDSDKTKDLMINFYQNIKEGNSNSRALNIAMNKIRKKNPHPFYWAPFVLIGE